MSRPTGLRGTWRMDLAGWVALRAASDMGELLPGVSADVSPHDQAAATEVLRDHDALVGEPPRPDRRLSAALDLLAAADTTLGGSLREGRRHTSATWALRGDLAAAHVLEHSPRGALVEVRLGSVDELADDVLRTLEVPQDDGVQAGDGTRVLSLAALAPDGSIRDGVGGEAPRVAFPPVARLVASTPAGMAEASWLHGAGGGVVRAEVVGDELRVQQWSTARLHRWLVSVLASSAVTQVPS